MRVAVSKAGSYVPNRGWRKVIGGQRFELGRDETKAVTLSLRIQTLWLTSGSIWTPNLLEQAKRIVEGGVPSASPACEPEQGQPIPVASLGETPTEHVAVLPGEVFTVSDAIERYRDAMLASLMSPATKHGLISRTKMMLKSPISGMPLAKVGPEQLSRLVNHYLSRPLGPKSQKPISVHSARMFVKTTRAMFDWLDLNGLWMAPRRFDRLFRIPRSLTYVPVVNVLTMDELVVLYREADSRQRLYILLGLNCGFANMEIASLRRRECHLDDGETPYIERARQKTGVTCRWELWPETADLLKKHMADTGELALLTYQGQPLVRYSNGYKTRQDNLKDVWRNLLIRADMSKKAFKLLRKTGATMMRAIAGIEVSEMYLAHSEQSMARFYSKPDGTKLSAALVKFRRQLAPMLGRQRNRRRVGAGAS